MLEVLALFFTEGKKGKGKENKSPFDKGGDPQDRGIFETYTKLQSSLKPMLDATSGLLDKAGIPTPVLGSIRDYFMTIYRKKLPTNLIQAQRDYFGAHTFERTDRPR